MVSAFAFGLPACDLAVSKVKRWKGHRRGGESSVPQSCRHRYLVAVWCFLDGQLQEGCKIDAR